MSSKQVKKLAIALLAIAIILVGWALWQSDKAARIQGPEAIVVVPEAGNQVWIGVGDALWRSDANGHFIDAVPLASLGLPGAPAQLLRHPAGGIVATVRDHPTLYGLDPVTAHVQKRLTPSWPADLKAHAARAINVALHADGRIAIATGGGHAVALFDGDGRFIARSAPDTFRFTNGLWWQGSHLWTTDTNRFRLHQLDGQTLQMRQSKALDAGAQPYLGAARATARGDQVALFRHANGMVLGDVVLLDAAMKPQTLPHDTALEPRELDWLGDTLLVTDGVSRQVLRWNTRAQALSPFGDDDLRARFTRLAAERGTADRRYRGLLKAGIAVFLVAFGLAVWAERLARQAVPAGQRLDLSRLGTPACSAQAMRLLMWRVYGGLVGVATGMIALQALPRWLLHSGWVPKAAHLPMLIALAMAVLASVALMVAQMRRIRRLSARPELEPVFNRRAVQRLHGSRTLSPTLRDGEQVLETFMLQRMGLQWVVLTTERLLVFAITAFDSKLTASHERSDIVAIETASGVWPRRRPQPWHSRAPSPTLRGDWLTVQFANARPLAGYVGAPTVIDRLVASGLSAPKHHAGTHRSDAVTPPRDTRESRSAQLMRDPQTSRVAATNASALVPGLGQWMQRRRSTALLVFLMWSMVMLTTVVPIVWTLAGPRADVSVATVVLSALALIFWSAFAAWDAWRMHQPARRRPQKHV